ncbi:hypothetical protein LJC63_04315 [Ruminococcaceae bacterium OttesenSCG-928-L11]|nr:hypothetical protein [Ruminococcaceae bacterium OttesenSCG-928-L11]
MVRVFAGIKRKAFDILGLDRMGERYQKLAQNYIFLVFYTTLESVFVNTLLYKISPSMTGVVIYRAITYVAAAITMHLAAYICQKKSPLVVIRLGGMFYLLMYVALFFGLNYMDKLNYFVAFLAGTGGAFYWTAHNILVSHYTTKNNRDIGISALGVIQGIITLFCPVISGFVIARMPGDIGYRIMFGVGMLCVVAQIRVQLKLTPVEQTIHKSQLRLAIKLLLGKLTYKMLMAYEFVRGIRDGTFAFIVNMLLFEIITDESLVGINTFLTGIMAIIGSWVYGRLVRRHNRGQYLIVVTTLLLGVCSLLFLKMNAPMVMLFNVINSFLQLFIINSCNNTTFDVLGENNSTRKSMGEMLAIREGAMAAGRICGLAIMMALPQNATGYVTAMCLLTASQYIVAFIMWRVQRTLQRKEQASVPVGGTL